MRMLHLNLLPVGQVSVDFGHGVVANDHNMGLAHLLQGVVQPQRAAQRVPVGMQVRDNQKRFRLVQELGGACE
jgi:hypothetical protein